MEVNQGREANSDSEEDQVASRRLTEKKVQQRHWIGKQLESEQSWSGIEAKGESIL